MAEEFKKTGLMDGMGEGDDDDFKYDPEGGGNVKYRLPFALCKENGIPIQDWWTPRDAWDALKNGGYVEDVDEEYAKRAKEEKREKEKEWRKEHPEQVKKWAARAKIKKEQLKNPEHNPDKNYIHEDGKIAGAEKGAPMTFEQADSGSVNPYYGTEQIGYVTNCQTCVATFVARKLGYNVRALPNLNNKNIADLSHDVTLAYVDENGNPPKAESITRRDIAGTPPGTMYALRWTWQGRNSGHIVIMQNDGSGAYLYDPQTNEKYVSQEEIGNFLKDGMRFARIDLTNCTINEKFCDKIMKGAKKNG